MEKPTQIWNPGDVSMKDKEYQALRDKFLKETLDLSDLKRIEYTEGNQNDNVLWNLPHILYTISI